MTNQQQLLTALVTLPVTYNADARGRRKQIESSKYERTMEEIAKQFGGGVLWQFGSATPRGYWWSRGILYKDDLAAVEVDIPNDADSRAWLENYARDVLLDRFKQEAIYIKFLGPIEVMTVEVESDK